MNFGRIGFRNVLLILIGFALPLFPKALLVLILLLLLEWLINPDLKKNLLTAIKTPLCLLFMTLYFLYIAGLLYSENLAYGIADLEAKLPLLVFPLIFSTPAYISSKTFRQLLKAFICGNFLAFIICMISAIYKYMKEPSIDLFESINFSIILHPSYFAMYITLSVIILVYELFNTKLKPLTIILLVFILMLFTTAIFLLSSKMGIISFILIVFCFMLVQIISKKQYIQGLFSLGILFLITFLAFYFSPNLPGRFNNAVLAITSTVQPTEVESSALRTMTWKTSLEIVKENPLIGVGTGDIKDVLLVKYESNGMNYALERRLNAHNQFLQTAGALGIIGLLILLLCFVIPIYISIKHRNLVYFFFLLLIFLNFLVESMLETQAGVVFYAFFNSLFLFSLKDNKA